MSPNEFLEDLLSRVNLGIGDEDRKMIEEKQNALRIALREKLPLKDDFLTGSYRRHTILKPKEEGEEFDVDTFVAFDNADYGEKELGDLRALVIAALQEIMEENEDLGIVEVSDDQRRSVCVDFGGGFTIDVVPAIEIEKDVLYKIYDKQTLDSVETNPKLHGSLLSEANVRSGGKLVPIIKILKAWKRDKCDFVKSIHIELLAVDLLGDSEIASYAEGVASFFSSAHEKLQTACLYDPANSKHCIDAYLDDDDTRQQLLSLIAIESETAASAIDAENSDEGDPASFWEEIFGQVKTNESTKALADWSHAATPPWTNAIASSQSVVIHAELFDPRQKSHGIVMSRGFQAFPSYALKYTAEVHGIASPYEIRWQVVNTGQHAASIAGGLRGKDFSAGKTLTGKLVGNPLINWEYAKYHGTHWIECFVVCNGRLAARSGPFYVPVHNPLWNRYKKPGRR